MTDEAADRLRYRLLIGSDDQAICERASQALGSGYELHGSPAIAAAASGVVVAQEVVLGGGTDR